MASASAMLATLSTDLRTRYCILKPAADFFTTVNDGSRISQIQQELANITGALGYEPTCVA
jgi:hypothetical protein